jgi:hypothetical protein
VAGVGGANRTAAPVNDIWAISICGGIPGNDAPSLCVATPGRPVTAAGLDPRSARSRCAR